MSFARRMLVLGYVRTQHYPVSAVAFLVTPKPTRMIDEMVPILKPKVGSLLFISCHSLARAGDLIHDAVV